PRSDRPLPTAAGTVAPDPVRVEPSGSADGASAPGAEHALSLIDRVHRSGVSDPREVFARAGAPARFRVGSIVKDGRRGRPRPRGKEDLMVVTALTPAVLRSTPTCSDAPDPSRRPAPRVAGPPPRSPSDDLVLRLGHLPHHRLRQPRRSHRTHRSRP